MPSPNRIFLSYASEDLEKAQKIYAGLSRHGLDVWFDKKRKKIGQWKPRILKAIAESKYFLICISEACLLKIGDDPSFQDEELRTAWDIANNLSEWDFTIIPVRLERCGRGDRRLTVFQQFDLFEDWGGVLNQIALQCSSKSLVYVYGFVEEGARESEQRVKSLYGKATIYYHQGKFKKALGELSLIEEIEGETSLSLNRKGILLDALNRFTEARSTLERSLEINSESAPVYNNKGVVLCHLGLFINAQVAFEQALKIDPDYTVALQNRGLACFNNIKYQYMDRAEDS